MRDGCGVVGEPAPHVAGHWPAAEDRGRRAGIDSRSASVGLVHVGTGYLPRLPVRRGRIDVVLVEPRYLDVHGVLRVPARRLVVHAHVCADCLVHRHQISGDQRRDRAETRGRRIPVSEEEQHGTTSRRWRRPSNASARTAVAREMPRRRYSVRHGFTDEFQKQLQHE